MRKFDWLIVVFVLFFAVGCLLSISPASADNKKEEKAAPKKAPPGKPGPRRFEGHDFRHGGHDYRHFDARERKMWHGGRWRHEMYMGRMGYWWEVDGMWYFFNKPVYPYPTVIPTIAFEGPLAVPIGAPPVVVQPPPPQPVVMVQQPGQWWYWCPNPAGFSPYITKCPSGWQKRPATAQTPPPPQMEDKKLATGQTPTPAPIEAPPVHYTLPTIEDIK